MRVGRKIASSLLVCVGLLMAWFASPALAAGRGNAADFAGVWDTVASSGAEYRMTLRVDATSVSGEFVNSTHPELSGYIFGTVDPSLDGKASGGVLTYVWNQPNIQPEIQGKGSFIVTTDGTMAGFFTIDGPSKKKHTWEGKRIATAPKPSPKPGPTQNGVKVTADTTGYDAPGGNDKCYLNPGDTAGLLGVDKDDPTWKHLQGTDACDGEDFWVYDDGVLRDL